MIASGSCNIWAQKNYMKMCWSWTVPWQVFNIWQATAEKVSNQRTWPYCSISWANSKHRNVLPNIGLWCFCCNSSCCHISCNACTHKCKYKSLVNSFFRGFAYHPTNPEKAPMGLLPDTCNCGCACAGNAENVFPATAGTRSRHASRHVRHARSVMHAGIAN